MPSSLAPSTSWHNFLPATAHVILHHVRSIKQTTNTAVHATLSLLRRPAPFRAAGPLLPFLLPSLSSFLPFPSLPCLVVFALSRGPGTGPGRPGTIQIFFFCAIFFSRILIRLGCQWGSHTHPSHSQTSRLLTSSLSLGVPVPRPTQCMGGA
jgi:hypothetical protein